MTIPANPRDKTGPTSAQKRVRLSVTCGHCGRTVQRQARQQLYCSLRCRVSAHRAKSALQFWGSTLRISRPRYVIEAEVFGDRSWQFMTSPGGITVEVSRLSTRAVGVGP